MRLRANPGVSLLLGVTLTVGVWLQADEAEARRREEPSSRKSTPGQRVGDYPRALAAMEEDDARAALKALSRAEARAATARSEQAAGRPKLTPLKATGSAEPGPVNAKPSAPAGADLATPTRIAFLRGRALFQLRRFDEAAAAFSLVASSKRWPLPDYASYYLGESLFRAGRFDEAHDAFRRASKEKRSHWAEAATMRRADALYASGRYGKAQSEYTKLLKEYPEFPRRDLVQLAIADCDRRRGKLSDAASQLQDLWLSEPASRGARLAHRLLERLRKRGVTPKSPTYDALLSRIRSLRLARRYGQALGEAVRLRERLEKKGDRERARRATLEIALAHLGADDPRRAEAIFVELHKTAPTARVRDSMNYWIARARDRAGNIEGAVKAYLARVDYRPRTALGAEYLWDAATTAFDGGKYQLAEQLFERYAKEHGGGGRQLAWFRTWLAYRKGDHDRARKGFERLRRAAPVMARYWLARVTDAQGQNAKAVEMWKQLARSDAGGYYGYLARSRLVERGVDVGKLVPLVATSPGGRSEEGSPEAGEAIRLVPDEPDESRSGPASVADGPVSLADGDRPLVSLSPLTEDRSEPESLPDLTSLVESLPEGPTSRSGAARTSAARARTVVDTLVAYERVAARWGKKLPRLMRVSELRAVGLREDAARELRTLVASSGYLRVGTHTLGLSWRGPKGNRRILERLKRVPAKAFREIGALAREAGDSNLAMRILPGPSPDRRYYPRAYQKLVVSVASEFGLEPNLLWALMRTESSFQNYVTSRAGARGLMQIMPKTGRNIAESLGYEAWSPDALYDPQVSLRFAGWYFRQLLDKFRGQLPLAIGSYNGGPHNLARWLKAKGDKLALDEFVEEIPFRETRGYVKKVLRVMATYRRLYEDRDDLVITQQLNTDVGDNINY